MLLRDAKDMDKPPTEENLSQDVLAATVSGRYVLYYAPNIDLGCPHLCLTFQFSPWR